MQRGHREHLSPFMARAAKAFHNHGPQAVAAMGFHNPYVHPDERQHVRLKSQAESAHATVELTAYTGVAAFNIGF